MAYHINRLTLFAILSSLESDLRSYVARTLLTQRTLAELLPPETFCRVQQRAKISAEEPHTGHNGNYLAYLDFADPIQIIARNRSLLSPIDQTYFKKITSSLERLIPVRNRVMHGRPLQFDDFSMATEAAKDFSKIKKEFFPSLSESLRKLEENPGFVLSLNADFSNPHEKTSNNLPIPDFDETGFLGRGADCARLLQHLLGPYPVISLIGEGGVGKTALALKVAYDFLDDNKSPFEAIIWTSAKHQKITQSEIVNIKNAVADSIGVFNSISHALGATEQSGDWAEIIEYLSTFRILLIIDNLETVLDNRIRDFLQQLPAGSKVLLTSRLAVGAYDFPYTLMPLQEGEAAQLMRALALAHNLESLSTSKQTTLIEYSRKLRRNPGFIKWFIACVATGERPENVLSPTRMKMFLEFCMSHIYEHFSGKTKNLLSTMLCASGKQSFAMLQYLSDLDVVELERSLQKLIAANFARMSTSDSGTVYDIKELANLFLQNYKMPSKQFAETIQKKRNTLVSHSEGTAQASQLWPYNPNNIYVGTASDRIAAKYLIDALSFVRTRRFDDARQLIEKAKALCHDYFEIYRVEAWLSVEYGLFTKARDCYEYALSLAPQYAPLRLLFAGFLIRYCEEEISLAVQHLHEGQRLDPGAVEFALELNRIRLYQRNFEVVEQEIYSLLHTKEMSEWNKKKAYNILFQLHKRKAETYIEQKEYQRAWEEFRSLRRCYLACPEPFRDRKNEQVIGSCVPGVRQMKYMLGKMLVPIVEEDVGQFFEGAGRSIDIRHVISAENKQEGKVSKIVDGKQFGFILTAERTEYFFHRDGLCDSWAWEGLCKGALVKFVVGYNDRGECAVDVEVV